MKSILSGELLVLQNNEVIKVACPRYKEITVSAVYCMAKKQSTVTHYMVPYLDEERVPRKWLFNVSDNIYFVNLTFCR